MIDTSHPEFIPFQLKDIDGNSLGWHAAFRDRWYGDYVIEFGVKFDSSDAVTQAVSEGRVHPNFSNKFEEK